MPRLVDSRNLEVKLVLTLLLGSIVIRNFDHTGSWETGAVAGVYVGEIAKTIQSGPEGLPVDFVLGIEAGLIGTFNPPWTQRRER